MRSRYRCSMCPAIHINSRSWLRSSSTHEPSDPPLRVVIFVFSDIAARSLARASHDDDRWRQVAPPGPRNVLRTGIDETRSRRCELPSTIQVTEWWRECEVDVRSGDRSGDSLNLAETSCPRTTRDASFEIGTHRVQRTPEKCVRNAFTNTGIQARERAISGARVVERTAASFTSRTADDA